MKQFNKILFLAVAVLLSSCASNLMEKRVHRKGFHFRGISVKKEHPKPKEGRKIEPASAVSESSIVNDKKQKGSFEDFDSSVNNEKLTKKAILVSKRINSSIQKKKAHVFNDKQAEQISLHDDSEESKSNKKRRLDLWVLLLGVPFLGTYISKKKISNLSRWASRNKRKARAALISCQSLLVGSSFYLGNELSTYGFEFSESAKLSLAIAGTTLAATSLSSKKLSFIKTKMKLTVLPVLGFAMMLNSGLSMNSNKIAEQAQTKRIEIHHAESNANHSLEEDKKHFSTWEKIGVITLILALSFALIVAISAFSCSISCGGFPLVAYFSFFILNAAVLTLLFLAIRYVLLGDKLSNPRIGKKALQLIYLISGVALVLFFLYLNAVSFF